MIAGYSKQKIHSVKLKLPTSLLGATMTKNKKDNDTKNKKDNDTTRKYYIKRMINSVRKDLAALSKEWSHEELVELDPRLSDDSDF